MVSKTKERGRKALWAQEGLDSSGSEACSDVSGSLFRIYRSPPNAASSTQVCHSYSVEEAALQAAVLGYLGECEFGGSCTALPLADAPSPGASRFITTTEAGTYVPSVRIPRGG